MKAKTAKTSRPDSFRNILGFSTVIFSNTFATTVLGIFMLFITDYSGIDSLVGQVGYAAGFATIFLLLTRIVDAVDDPLQGWLMDSAKESKFGKYRTFGIIGTILVTVGAIMLFALPTAVKAAPALLWVWCIVGYLLLETGSAMSIATPILQKSTTDAKVRTKITSFIRFAIVIAAIPATFFVTIVEAVAANGGDLGATATKIAVIFALAFAAITFIGIALIREPFHPAAVSGEEKKKLGVKEIGTMLKVNKPMWAHNIAYFIGNMNYTISASVMAYFLKWYFCADLTTGVVDGVTFASLTGIYGLVTLLPNFLAPLTSPLLIKFTKSVDKAMQFCMTMIAVLFVIVYLLAITGILKTMPIVFFLLYFLIMMPSGMGAIFNLLLNIDCADYAEYQTGMNMTAITNSVSNVCTKAQNAIGGVIPGILLMMVGYSVDSVTGAYVGDLAKLPQMVSGLSVVAALIPAVLALTCALLYKFTYKVTPEFRQEITDELNRRHTQNKVTESK